MPEIGKKLKEARIKKNITLQEAEKETKIRKFYLSSLENEDFENLPEKIYAVGFLKTYAKYLGLEYDDMVEELKQNLSSSIQENDVKIPIKKTSQRTLIRTLISNFRPKIVIVILLLVFITVPLYYFYNSNGTENYNKKTEISNTAEKKLNDNPVQKISNDTGNNSSNEIKYEGANLKIIVYRQECWMRVLGDGKLLFSGTLKKGQEKEFKANQEIKVKFGNAGAVKAVFNGETYEKLGDLKEVKEKTFRIRNN